MTALCPRRSLVSGGSTGQIEWAPTAAADGTFDQVHFGEDVLRIRSPRSAYLADLRRLFPAEGSAIDGYARAIEYGNVSMFVYVALKLLPRCLHRFLLKFACALLPLKTTAEVRSRAKKLETLFPPCSFSLRTIEKLTSDLFLLTLYFC